ADKGLGYADYNHPMPVETFCAYGLAFQQRFVPDLEDESVVSLEPAPEGFRLALDNGETLGAAKVVVAVGAGHFRYVPDTLAHRPGWKRWYPMSGLGGGWPNRFYENAPMLFRRLPEDMRTRIVRTWLGPAGAWPVRERVESAPLHLGQTLRSASVNGPKVHLR